MSNLTRDFFIGLSNNEYLNKTAKKWGFRLGADKFVAGTNIESVTNIVKELNSHGITCTLDRLGEFVSEREEATEAKEGCINLLEKIKSENLNCHVSIKLTQLGLDIDENFCVNNMQEILQVANAYNIFINIDMEDYARYEQTFDVLHILRKEYDNIGTVIQSYLHRTESDLDQLQDVRLRLVKGAYKESEKVAYQDKKKIDRNFIQLAKTRLLGRTFTSIATHDHHLIEELIDFIRANNIDQEMFEFQMLYGFRNDMQYSLAEEGYNFCTYIPFGIDWFGYFMRRMAERPQNINLVMKDTLYTKDNKLKKKPVIAGGVAAILFVLLLWKRKKNK
ncbi:proline dehydrogenase [Virgibacillus natechei]|uniref:proline dehydrogenase n=1 Tax=Virgibacillus natechei TaxID=1216297 RepID=A0ABS4IE46_9BACI|nr:proline dehydrogenase family protein [Virgibacillus natechei]MBP1969128.1 proline dehydrogenase [Virgibacillus natechei]UZD14393.1 proline dehydrogenase family protein [Virgibacillus natechei]